MLNPELYRVIIDSMSAHVAILNEYGIIIDTNQSWQDFGRDNGMLEPYDSVGVDYFGACVEPEKNGDTKEVTVADGIRSVLRGELSEFLDHYPCHSPTERRWFAVRVVPFTFGERRHAIVTHENITSIIEIQDTLERKEAELRNEQERLEETNIALRVLLKQREQDKKQIEETVYGNVDQLVLPYTEQLLQSRLTDRQRILTEVIDGNLREIISPFIRNLASLSMVLTPQELEVAHLVRSGRSSQEIADVQGISKSGVDFHRKKLRKKLGLTNSAKNLRSYLLSLD